MIEHYLFEFEVNKRKFEEAIKENSYENAMMAYKAELELLDKINQHFIDEANAQARKATILLVLIVIIACVIYGFIVR